MAVQKTPKSPPKAFTREIATTGDAKDILRGPVDVWQPYDFGILRDIGGNLDTFERVLQDWEVQSSLQQRRLALVSKKWNVEPASDSDIDVAAADSMRENLEAINWDDINDKMHYGIFYGYSVAELMYARDGSRIVADCIKVKNRRRFRWGQKGELRLLTRNDPAKGEIMPPGKFWTFATGGDNHDNPYGIGLAHWLYWPTYFKNNDIKFWMIFVDKFAMPTAVGTHTFGDDEVKVQQVLAALQAIHTDSGVAIPKGSVEIELMEAVRSGTSDYHTLAKYMDAAIQHVTIGQSASTEGTAGKLGNEELQGEVREDIIKADSDLLCESWNRGPGTWLTAWNFPGAKPPRVWREVEAEEDSNERADRDTKIKSMGFKPTLDYITETYGEGWEESEAPDPGGNNPPPDTEFAAGSHRPAPDILDAALDQLLTGDEGLNKLSEQVIRPVFNLVQRVGPEKALVRLVELYPQISADKFTEALARVQFVANVWGRLNA